MLRLLLRLHCQSETKRARDAGKEGLGQDKIGRKKRRVGGGEGGREGVGGKGTRRSDARNRG